MQRAIGIATGFILISLGGCSEGGLIEVDAHDGPGMRMSGLGTNYAWIQVPQGTRQNPEINELLLSTIDEELAKRGFKKTEAESASFLAEYRVTRENKTDASVVPHGVVYPMGTLIVRLVDPTTRKCIWAASATARILGNAPPDERRRRVQDGVHQMLSKMPPR